MATSLKNSLLSLLLALKRLEVPLAKQESAALAGIGEQLMYAPDAWDIIEPDLMAVIEGNPALRPLYQESLTLVKQFNGKFSPNLLPNLAELQAELPSPSKEPASSSYFMERATKDNPELEADSESLEILNVSIKVLASSQPEKAAKNVSGLQRVWQFLQKPIKL